MILMNGGEPGRKKYTALLTIATMGSSISTADSPWRSGSTGGAFSCTSTLE
ncbi:hypothetical protein [Streptomyces lydicus]|uniref:hypothetical protein n=1 Tax=Streptomyces lydicus TaxID=47763 RepID=UPI0013E93D05|nr:hypothetical protein [Streptomyces lydicus]MCZ1006248.1 hypothetical protein [Streptomyces lydicus]